MLLSHVEAKLRKLKLKEVNCVFNSISYELAPEMKAQISFSVVWRLFLRMYLGYIVLFFVLFIEH